MANLRFGQFLSFRSHYGRYLVAEPNGSLDADRQNIGAWEKFQILSSNNLDQTGAIRYGTSVVLLSAHHKYVNVDIWGGAHSNFSTPSSFTGFTLVDPSEPSSTAIVDDRKPLALRSDMNRYLVADSNSNVNANSNNIGTSEQWDVIINEEKTELYELEFRLDKLQVHYDGDSGANTGELYWRITFDGRDISHRTENQPINLSSGNTYPFSSIMRNGELGVCRIRLDGTRSVFPIYASFREQDGGLRGEDDFFGNKTENIFFSNVIINPGQRTIRLQNDEGDVEIFYTVLVRTWNGLRYETPEYPSFALPEDARPDEDLPWLIGLSGNELTTYESMAKGRSVDEPIQLGQKIKEIGDRLRALPDNNSGTIETAASLGAFSIEATANFAAAGAEAGAVGLILFGTINLVAQPLIFSSTDYNNTIFVANYSTRQVKVRELFQDTGTYTYGPIDGVIPGRTNNKIFIGVFVFEKKFGLFGTAGALEFGAYGSMPKIRVGYSLPYRDTAAIRRRNKCAIEVGGDGTLEDFFDKKLGYDGTTPVANDTDSHADIETFCAINSTTHEFTQMYVAIKDR